MNGRRLVWFRRDLRDHDHAPLAAALADPGAVYCAFVFDTDILDTLQDKADRRVEFIQRSLEELHAALRRRGGGLIVRHGRAAAEIVTLARALEVDAVHAGRDYEPAARARDATVARDLRDAGIAFVDHKDQALFDCEEVLTRDGRPFTVFTPYKHRWLERASEDDFLPRDAVRPAGRLAPPPEDDGVPSLARIGFRSTDLLDLGWAPGMGGGQTALAAFNARLEQYQEARDFPAVEGTSRLSPHLRFGTVPVRGLARMARQRGGPGAATWLSELIWRDFYFAIMHHFPHAASGAFRPEYADLAFPGGPERFVAWCEGRTGYPLVDAAMRQLARTGWMHNRLRMVTASFLTKDLHVDWRLGERHFARLLLDFDLSANNGGWQWAASTGCDAQPWFRIFNPVTQSRRFDPDGAFIRRFVPEIAGCSDQAIHEPWTMGPVDQATARVRIGADYPAPVVDHAAARLVTLALYKRDGPSAPAAGRGRAQSS